MVDVEVEHIGRDSALAEHGVVVKKVASTPYVSEVNGIVGALAIDADSCALCAQHPNTCNGCPLAELRAGNACDEAIEDEDGDEEMGPYEAFTDDGDPEPMIAALQKCLEQVSGITDAAGEKQK